MHALGHVAQAVHVVRLDRLLDELGVQPRVLQPADDAHRLAGRPALVSVHAQHGVRGHGRADRRKARKVQLHVGSDLDLEDAEAAAAGGQGVGDHGVHVVDADGDVRLQALPRAAEQLVERDAPLLADQVVDRHLHRGLGRGVVDHRALDGVVHLVRVRHLAAEDLGREEAADGARDGGNRVARDDGRGRRLAKAEGAFVRLQRHDDVFHVFHRAQRGLKGREKRYLHRVQMDSGYLHLSPAPLPWSSNCNPLYDKTPAETRRPVRFAKSSRGILQEKGPIEREGEEPPEQVRQEERKARPVRAPQPA